MFKQVKHKVGTGAPPPNRAPSNGPLSFLDLKFVILILKRMGR